MAVTHKAVFAQGVKTVTASLTAAKSNWGDSSNATLIFTANANGAMIVGAKVIPDASAPARTFMVYQSTDSGVTFESLSRFAAAAAEPNADPQEWPNLSLDKYLRIAPNAQVHVAMDTALVDGYTISLQIEEL